MQALDAEAKQNDLIFSFVQNGLAFGLVQRNQWVVGLGWKKQNLTRADSSHFDGVPVVCIQHCNPFGRHILNEYAFYT